MAEYPHDPGKVLFVQPPNANLVIEMRAGLTTGTNQPATQYDTHDDVLAVAPAAYEAWTTDTDYQDTDRLVKYEGKVYRLIQAHTNFDPTHTPDVTPALWVHARPEGVVLPWEQPSAENPYMIGDQVLWTDGLTYKSVIKNNVWSVSGYPQGWEVVPPT